MEAKRLKGNEAIDVLIAEDSEIQGLSLKRFLEEKGYQVRWGRNGAEALRLAKEKKPDIVLSDIVMPVMDGFSLTKGLKAEESLK
ncbi:MAG: response regulator, partial [Deltaproteobacteria bacterium]|nr:response regulator [Deltaproteobacteria bacterium]